MIKKKIKGGEHEKDCNYSVSIDGEFFPGL